MLIGISGKIKSGKSTVTDMLLKLLPGTEEKQFANKLKQIVCLLTGCTIEELNNQAFKSSSTEVIWNRTIKEAREWIILKYFQTISKIPYGDMAYKDDAEVRAMALEQGFQFRRTYRDMLQEIGTDLFRDKFHPQTWVNSLFADWAGPLSSKWIISDTRFPDEAKVIKEHEGIVIRIKRPGIDESSNHSSETALDKYDKFDAIINNDGTLEQLETKLKEIISKFNLT